MNIHEYANELICIFRYNNKGCSMNLNLIPILQIYVESKQKYDLFTVCNVKFENKILVAMETEIFNSCL